MALPWTMIPAGENPVPNSHLEMGGSRRRQRLTWGKEKMDSSLGDQEEKTTEGMRPKYSLSAGVAESSLGPSVGFGLLGLQVSEDL